MEDGKGLVGPGFCVVASDTHRRAAKGAYEAEFPPPGGPALNLQPSLRPQVQRREGDC